MPGHPRQLDPDELLAEIRSLRGLARALVGDGHVAEDLVQDAWVTALDRPAPSPWGMKPAP